MYLEWLFFTGRFSSRMQWVIQDTQNLRDGVWCQLMFHGRHKTGIGRCARQFRLCSELEMCRRNVSTGWFLPFRYFYSCILQMWKWAGREHQEKGHADLVELEQQKSNTEGEGR